MRLPILQLSCMLCGETSHHPGLSAPLQPRFGSLLLLVFPKAKIAFERKEISEYDGHTVYKLSQRRLTTDWLAPRESDCSQTHSKVSYDWLPSYINVTWSVLEILKTTRYFPDSTRTHSYPCAGEIKWNAITTKQQAIYYNSPVACLNNKMKPPYGTLAAMGGLKFARNLKNVGQWGVGSRRCQR